MSDAEKRTIEFPAEVAPELLENPDHESPPPDFDDPGFDRGQLVTLHGYIGLKEPGKYIHLHHMKDYRAYYKIPAGWIYSCKPEPGGSLKGLHVLQVHGGAPLRYFHATTVDLPAQAIADAILLCNEHNQHHRHHRKHPKKPDRPVDRPVPQLQGGMLPRQPMPLPVVLAGPQRGLRQDVRIRGLDPQGLRVFVPDSPPPGIIRRPPCYEWSAWPGSPASGPQFDEIPGGPMTTRRLSSIISLIAGGLLSVLLVMLGPDLFYAIDWRVRKFFGLLAFVGILLALKPLLLKVRPGDDLPLEDDARGAAPRWPAWAGLVAVSALAFPLLRHPGNLGFGDWDLFLGKYEAARRTVAIWGQFPWWDPWSRGGFPLAANPQCGVWGVAMPLVLAFGTSVGMRLATLACFLLAIEGARRLAGLWLGDPLAAALAGLIYGLNGAVLVAAVAAYHVSMCYAVLPWMLYHVARLGRLRSAGVWLGFWAAFNLLNGIQYFTVYTALIAGVAWLRALVTQPRPGRRRFLAHTVLAGGVFLGLAGWRLATTMLVYRDFPRPYQSGFAENPWTILVHLLNRPSADFLVKAEATYFWSMTCYIGPVVFALAAISLRWGWRWWHTLALVCGWLASGSVGWYYPSYWLGHLPVFSTMHDVPRWRFMALLGVAMAAASVVREWRKDGRPGRRLLANLAMLAVAADYLEYGYEVLPVAFSIEPREARFPGPEVPTGEVVQIDEWLGFPAISRGYGIIFGYEPLMGYDRRATTARRHRGGPGYAGEHWTAKGPARVASWSPNRIVLEVDPFEEVFINQNPGSWWWVNGRPAFEGMRCAEKERTFAVVADDRGRVVLEIRPKGLAIGLALHLAGGLLALGTWLALRRPPGTPVGKVAART